MEFPDVPLPTTSYKSTSSLSTICPICFVEGAKSVNKYLHIFRAYKKINPHHVRTGVVFRIEGTIRNACECFKTHGNPTLLEVHGNVGLGTHGNQCLRAHENQCLGTHENLCGNAGSPVGSCLPSIYAGAGRSSLSMVDGSHLPHHALGCAFLLFTAWLPSTTPSSSGLPFYKTFYKPPYKTFQNQVSTCK
jgi:hypothetical protein